MGCANSTIEDTLPKLHTHYVGDFDYWDTEGGKVDAQKSQGRIIHTTQDNEFPERIGYAFVGISNVSSVPDTKQIWNYGVMYRDGATVKALLRNKNGSVEYWHVRPDGMIDSLFMEKKCWQGVFTPVHLK